MTTASVQLIRSATTKVTIAGKVLLIDPMLGSKGSFPGFEGTFRPELRNPLVDLPMPVEEVIAGVDAVIVTHTHTDHWDEAAQAAIPKDLLLFAQHEADATIIRSQGFTNVVVLTEASGKKPFADSTLSLTPTGGQHGCCAMYAIPPLAEVLGEIMGIVISAASSEGETTTIYFAGDTIWRPEVEAAIAAHKPDAVVIYAGYAMLQGFDDDSIIMGKADTVRAVKALDAVKAAAPPSADGGDDKKARASKVIAVHLEAINHCMATREDVRAYADEHGVGDRVVIPADGETVRI